MNGDGESHAIMLTTHPFYLKELSPYLRLDLRLLNPNYFDNSRKKIIQEYVDSEWSSHGIESSFKASKGSNLVNQYLECVSVSKSNFVKLYDASKTPPALNSENLNLFVYDAAEKIRDRGVVEIRQLITTDNNEFNVQLASLEYFFGKRLSEKLDYESHITTMYAAELGKSKAEFLNDIRVLIYDYQKRCNLVSFSDYLDSLQVM